MREDESETTERKSVNKRSPRTTNKKNKIRFRTIKTEYKNMKKRVVLREAQLHNVINEAVKRILKEEFDNNFELDQNNNAWGVEDYDNEAQPDGSIQVSLVRFVDGGRTSIESKWSLYNIDNLKNEWEVKAVCTESEDNRYSEGNEITFYLDKNTDILDIKSALDDALCEEGF